MPFYRNDVFHNGASFFLIDDITTYSGNGANQLGWKFGSNNDNPWKWDGETYLLPILYWQTTVPEMPEHLPYYL